MTAIVLPDLDRSTLEDLKNRMPSVRLSELELPSMERAGRQADEALDRLLGRSRTPNVWPWVAGIVAVAAIIGIAVAFFTMNRRPDWPSWPGRSSSTDDIVGFAEDTIGSATDGGFGGTDSPFGGGSGFGTDPDMPSIQEPQP
jgi:hypothetical protein